MNKNTLILACVLVVASIFFYFVDFLIFRDWHHMFQYLLGDLAFMFIDVLVVVVVIERILAGHEKQAIRYKLNMVIGAFFRELGTKLLFTILDSLATKQEIYKIIAVDQNWTHQDFITAQKSIYDVTDRPDLKLIDLFELKTFLGQKRQLMVQLITNPSVLENEGSAELLWAISHLEDELETRGNLGRLAEADLNHLSNDTYRVYRLLAGEWLNYVEHLKVKYPYLYTYICAHKPGST